MRGPLPRVSARTAAGGDAPVLRVRSRWPGPAVRRGLAGRRCGYGPWRAPAGPARGAPGRRPAAMAVSCASAQVSAARNRAAAVHARTGLPRQFSRPSRPYR